jgi:hypothetical protein
VECRVHVANHGHHRDRRLRAQQALFERVAWEQCANVDARLKAGICVYLEPRGEAPDGYFPRQRNITARSDTVVILEACQRRGRATIISLCVRSATVPEGW